MWVTPSQNRIFKFTFPTSASQVAVTSKSPDDICLTVSVQSPQVSRSLISFVFHFRTYIEWLCFFNFFNFKCPVFDTIYNVEYEGFRQTMTGQSTIIVQVRIFKYRRYSVFRLGKFLGNTLIPFWGGICLIHDTRAEKSIPRRLLPRLHSQHERWQMRQQPDTSAVQS